MYNQVILPHKVWRDIVGHMVSSEDAEVCGLLAGRFDDGIDGTQTAHVHYFTPILNVNPDPSALFVMDPYKQLDFFKTAHSNSLHVVGCVHSHPMGFGIPSEIDRQGINEDYAWLIWGHQDNRLRAWWPVITQEESRFRAAHLQCP